MNTTTQLRIEIIEFKDDEPRTCITEYNHELPIVAQISTVYDGGTTLIAFIADVGNLGYMAVEAHPVGICADALFCTYNDAVRYVLGCIHVVSKRIASDRKE